MSEKCEKKGKIFGGEQFRMRLFQLYKK